MRYLALAAALSLAASVPALAQSTATSSMSGLKLSGDKPIQIESDKLEVHQDQSLAIFTGNVTVVQGPTLLKAGKMLVYYVKGGNGNKGGDKGGDKGEAKAGADAKTDTKAGADAKDNAGPASATSAMTGSANIDHIEVDDKVYIKSDDQVATGDKGTFDMKTEVLVLEGKKVVLSQGPNVLVGCKLTVQMKTGLAQVDACGGRVMMSLTPNSQKR
jgi:lipopolysaccharide export system protein LptA